MFHLDHYLIYCVGKGLSFFSTSLHNLIHREKLAFQAYSHCALPGSLWWWKSRRNALRAFLLTCRPPPPKKIDLSRPVKTFARGPRKMLPATAESAELRWSNKSDKGSTTCHSYWVSKSKPFLLAVLIRKVALEKKYAWLCDVEVSVVYKRTKDILSVIALFKEAWKHGKECCFL